MRTIPELEEGTHKALATGTLPDGKPVVVNLDGTVSVVDQIPQVLGLPTVRTNSISGTAMGATFDSNSNKVVISYADFDNSSYGTAIVGTVNGTRISFGTPVVFESATLQGGSKWATTFDSDSNKVVIAYVGSSSGRAIVGTVSGTSITFGTAVNANWNNCTNISATFDSNVNKVVFVWDDDDSFGYGTSIVGTVSGTSITFGFPVIFAYQATRNARIVFDSNENKVVIFWGDQSASFYGKAIVGAISGTVVNFGSLYGFESSSIGSTLSATFDSNSNKVIVAYLKNSQGVVKVATVSGLGLTFGVVTFYTSGFTTSYPSVVFDSKVNKIVIGYALDRGNPAGFNQGVLISGRVNADGTVNFISDVVFNNGTNTVPVVCTYDSNLEKTVVVYQSGSNPGPDKLTSRVFQNQDEKLNSRNYIGMSKGGVCASGSRATIDVKGSLSTNQSGLTPGESYFVQTDGTLALTKGPDPSVFAGTAVSATSLLVKT